VPPPAFSPDGSTLVFGAGGKLWARSLKEVTARPLPGTENARFPFWSPDSRSIGFFADGQLKTIDAVGGAPLTLCSADDPRGGAWSRDGVIVFTPNVRMGIYRVPASGGAPSPVTTLDTSKHSTHRWPIFLPDGRHFLYLALSHAIPMSEESAIYVADLHGGQSRLVMRSHSNVVYASGHLLFLRGNSLMAQPFNLERLVLEGEAVRIADEVLYDAGVWRAVFTASENGLLAYQPGAEVPGSQLTWFDRSGKVLGMVGERGNYVAPRLSPDGHKLAVLILDPSPDVWVYDLDRGARTRLTFSSTVSGAAIWSPDGSRIAFSSARQNNQIAIYEKASSGAGRERILQQAEVPQDPTDWSPDGHWIVYDRSEMGSTGIGILPVNREQKSYSLVPARTHAWGGHFSPDGRWISYCSEESGTNEVYIVPFPGPGGKWQVSTGGGLSPRWERDFLSLARPHGSDGCRGQSPRIQH